MCFVVVPVRGLLRFYKRLNRNNVSYQLLSVIHTFAGMVEFINKKFTEKADHPSLFLYMVYKYMPDCRKHYQLFKYTK